METQLLRLHSWDFGYKGSKEKSRLQDLRAGVMEGASGAHQEGKSGAPEHY